MVDKHKARQQGQRMIAESRGRKVALVQYQTSLRRGTYYEAVWADHAERMERNVAAGQSRRTLQIIERLN